MVHRLKQLDLEVLENMVKVLKIKQNRTLFSHLM